MITPDLFLTVEHCRDSAKVALTFKLTSRLGLDGANDDVYGPWKLQAEPHIVLERQFEDLQNLALVCREDPAAVLRRLSAKGARLFKMLLPEDLREVLWKLRTRAETFAIVSEVRGIPWELLRFQGRPDDPQAEGPFFAEAFALMRGLPGLSDGGLPAPRFGPLHDLALIAHRDEDFQDERRAVEKLLEGSIGVTEIEPTAAGFIQTLGSNRYDAFHFAGHGSAAGDDPGGWTLSVDDEEKVYLEEVETALCGSSRSRPLVFLNACETGREGLALGGMEGWVSRFLEAGASAFIGTHWEVPGDKARVFAGVFYRRYLGGMPFGEAVRRARSELRDQFPEDPTWLAYAVYGHPASATGEMAQVFTEVVKKPARRLAAILAVAGLLLGLAVAGIWTGHQWQIRHDALAHNNRGVELLENGDLEDAALAFEAALALDPDLAGAHANRAELAVRQGDELTALTSYRRAVDLDGKNALYRYNLGNHLLRRAQTDEAMTALERAIELDPGLKAAYNELGNAHFELGRWSDARQVLEAGIALGDTPAVLYKNLARVLLEEGEAAAAIERLMRALKLYDGGPGRLEALQLLARSYADLDQPAQACGELERFFQAPGGILSPWALDARELSEKLDCGIAFSS